MPTTTPVRPDPAAATRRRPDPNPLRLVLGFVGLASATALATAMLPSIASPAAGAGAPTSLADVSAAVPAGGVAGITGVAAPAASPRHVTRYVRLAAGQTPPPDAVVQAVPTPTPRVRVVTTRQSGKP